MSQCDRPALDVRSEILEQKIDSLVEATRAIVADLRTFTREAIALEADVRALKEATGRLEQQFLDVQGKADDAGEVAKDRRDSLAALRESVDRGFFEMRNENKKQFTFIENAIRAWGERVQRVESQRRRLS